MSATLVTVIGPPAAGKTTLATGLAQSLGGTMLHEDFAGNPFLHDAYLCDSGVGLPCQLYFLMSRVKQLARSTWPATGLVVSDYDFCQDGVFARVRLSAADHGVYEAVASRVRPLIQPTGVLIHLRVSVEELLRRIHVRGRPHERGMTAAFLKAMLDSYASMDFSAVAPHVVTVDAEACDFRDPAGREKIARQVRQRLGVTA